MAEFSPYPARNIKEVLETSLEGSGETWFVFVCGVCVCVCVCVCVFGCAMWREWHNHF